MTIFEEIATNAGKHMGKGTLVHFIHSQWKSVWSFLRKLKVELLCCRYYIPGHTSQSWHPKRETPTCSVVLFAIVRKWSQPRYLSIETENVVCTPNCILCSGKGE